MPPEGTPIVTLSDLVNQLAPILGGIFVALAGLIGTIIYTSGRSLRQRQREAEERGKQDLTARAQEIQSEAATRELHLRLINNLMERNAVLESDQRKDRARLDRLEDEQKEALEREKVLGEQLGAEKIKADSLAREIAQLHLDINALKSQRDALIKEVQQEREARQTLENQRTKEKADWDVEREKLQGEVDQLKKQVKQLQAELDGMKPAITKLETGELPAAPTAESL